MRSAFAEPFGTPHAPPQGARGTVIMNRTAGVHPGRAGAPTKTYFPPPGVRRLNPMAKKSKAKGKGKKKAAAKRAPAQRAPASRKVDAAIFNAGMHDFTNLATALRAYLELLSSQGKLDEKQTYYVARSREQVEMLIDLVRELKEKL